MPVAKLGRACPPEPIGRTSNAAWGRSWTASHIRGGYYVLTYQQHLPFLLAAAFSAQMARPRANVQQDSKGMGQSAQASEAEFALGGKASVRCGETHAPAGRAGSCYRPWLGSWVEQERETAAGGLHPCAPNSGSHPQLQLKGF